MKRFKLFTCLYCDNDSSDYPKYEREQTMIDLNQIISFNAGNDSTTTVRLISGETLRVVMTFAKFCELMRTEPVEVLIINPN